MQVPHRHADRGRTVAAGPGKPRHADVMRLADAVEVPQLRPRQLVERGRDQPVAHHLAIEHDAAQRQRGRGVAVDRGQEAVVEGWCEQHLVDPVADQETGEAAWIHQRVGIGKPQLRTHAQRPEHLPDREDIDPHPHARRIGRVGVAPFIGELGRVLRDRDAFRSSGRPGGRHEIDRGVRPDRRRLQRRHRGVADGLQETPRIQHLAIPRQVARRHRLTGQHQRHAQLFTDFVQHRLRHRRVEMHEGPPVDHAGRGARGHGETGRAEDAHRRSIFEIRRAAFDEAAQLAIAQPARLVRHGGAGRMGRDSAHQRGADGLGEGHGNCFLGICYAKGPTGRVQGARAPARRRGKPRAARICDQDALELQPRAECARAKRRRSALP